MTQTEAMKLALEALKSISEMFDYEGNGFKLEYEIKALEEALAKQEQGEPVAYLTKRKLGGTEGLLRADMVDRSAKNQETHYFIPLYTTPQQRTWVDLSDADADDLFVETQRHMIGAGSREFTRIFTRLINAKLKEKNT